MAWLLSQPVLALEVKGLYEIEIVANSQTPQDRAIAFRQGMYAVLSRILIADDISTLPVVQDMLASAQSYIKQFQFSLIAADEQNASDARLIRIQFDEEQMLQALSKNPVGLWSDIRPETLLWLVVDDGSNRQFFNADTMPDIESGLAFASKLKGVPLIYPILDIEEQQRISVSEVLGTDSKNLLAASARYDVPAVMTGRIRHKDSCWQGDWAFYFDGKIKQWASPCQTLRATTVAGMQGAYSELANYYGLKPATPVVPLSQK